MASQNAIIAIKLLLRGQLRKKGYSRTDIEFMMDGAETPGFIDSAIADQGEAFATALAAAESGAVPTPTPGTGVFAQIIAALMTFLESPQGQALIAALIQMLIASLGHSVCKCGPASMESISEAELAKLRVSKMRRRLESDL